jgi:hypothetical protein
MSTGIALWTTAIIWIMITTSFLFYLLRRDGHFSSLINIYEINNLIVNVTVLLEKAHAFVAIVDSKLVGLAMFLIANVFTGVVNLSMHTDQASNVVALLILCLNSTVYTFLPFVCYYIYFCKQNRTKSFIA